jgi:hypothetical protein
VLGGLAGALVTPLIVQAGTTAGEYLLVLRSGKTNPTCATATVDGELCAAGDIETNGDLDVADDATITGDLTVVNDAILPTGSIGTAEIAANVIVSADVDADLVQVDNSQLTNTNMLALEATPVTLIAAVASTAIVVHKVALFFDWTADYTESADNIVIEYADGTDIVNIEATGFVDAGADAARVITPPNGALVELTGANAACDTTCGGPCLLGFDDGAADAEVVVVCSDAAADRCLCYRPIVPVSNSAVRITTIGSGEYGGGNAANTVSIRIWYSEVPMAAFSSGG